MYAMQYEIGLPADYDMTVIRRRVAEKGPLLDDLPGLGLKAYLIRERGVDGSPVNQYAPFYLWADTGGMGRFLWGGGGFGAIVSSFGRPPVRHWTGVACLRGDAALSEAQTATRETWPMAPDADPGAGVDSALNALACHAALQGVCMTALAVDPQSWQMVRFTLWDRESAQDAAVRYNVLHLSVPGMGGMAGPGKVSVQGGPETSRNLSDGCYRPDLGTATAEPQ